MGNTKVKTHKRNGKIVRSHSRKAKGTTMSTAHAKMAHARSFLKKKVSPKTRGSFTRVVGKKKRGASTKVMSIGKALQKSKNKK